MPPQAPSTYRAAYISEAVHETTVLSGPQDTCSRRVSPDCSDVQYTPTSEELGTVKCPTRKDGYAHVCRECGKGFESATRFQWVVTTYEDC